MKLFIFFLLCSMSFAQTTSFISPTDAQTLQFEFKVSTETQHGLLQADLQIIPSQPLGSHPLNALGVWIEVNNASDSELAEMEEGIPVWEQFVDYIVVSVTPSSAYIYDAMPESQVPIYPGLKPLANFNCVLGPDDVHYSCDINDIIALTKTADVIKSIILQTDSDRIILEWETTVFGHTDGWIVLDEDIFRAGLEQFPKDVIYYWWPAVTSFYPDRAARQEKLLRIVAEVLPNVRFFDSTHSRHKYIFRDFHKPNREMNLSLNDNYLVHMMYPNANQEYWRDDQVVSVLEELFGYAEVIMYPGLSGFAQQGNIFKTRVPRRNPIP